MSPTLNNRRKRHQQAVDLINRRKEDGSPFLLYLRDFLGGSREGVVKSHYYTPDDRFTIDNVLIEQLSPDVGVVFVQSEAEEQRFTGEERHSNAPRGPSLQLSDNIWKETVKELINLAEVVFVDAPILSDGTRFELECCLKQNKVHQTVVILPAPNFMRWEERLEPADEANKLIQQFTRVVWDDDLRNDAAGDFTLRDLVQRARDVASCSVARRIELLENGKFGQTFPVRYTDVASEYAFRSALRAQARQPWHNDPTEDNWERTFWGFHRATLTIHATIDLGVVEVENCVDLLIECYIAMVNLLGEAHVSERGTILRGDYELCKRLSEIAVRWAQKSEKPEVLKICKEMLAEVTRRADWLMAERIPHHVILRHLYLADEQVVVTV